MLISFLCSKNKCHNSFRVGTMWGGCWVGTKLRECWFGLFVLQQLCLQIPHNGLTVGRLLSGVFVERMLMSYLWLEDDWPFAIHSSYWKISGNTCSFQSHCRDGRGRRQWSPSCKEMGRMLSIWEPLFSSCLVLFVLAGQHPLNNVPTQQPPHILPT